MVLAAALLLGGTAEAAADPFRPKQWALDVIGAPAAWTAATGSGMTVAVIDTGIDLQHEDLKDKLVAGRNVLEAGQPPQDDHGHGTHVAGIAAAKSNNGAGIAAVAPDAKIMPVRALKSECEEGAEAGCGASGTSRDIADAIRWAADNGAHVVNLSISDDVLVRNVLGSSIGDALNYAWDHGAVPVVAAGNDAIFPSGYADVNAIVVVATDRTDRKASYSNSAGSGLSTAKWSLAAPGGGAVGNQDDDIVSTLWMPGKQNQYGFAAGTSMAVPHVAGAVAILRSLGLTPLESVQRLLSSAKDLGSPGPDSTYGAGRLDVQAAVASYRKDPAQATTRPTAPPATQAPSPVAESGRSANPTNAPRPRRAEPPLGAIPSAIPPPGAEPGEAVEPIAEPERIVSAPETTRPSSSRASTIVAAALTIGGLGVGAALAYRRLRP